MLKGSIGWVSCIHVPGYCYITQAHYKLRSNECIIKLLHCVHGCIHGSDCAEWLCRTCCWSPWVHRQCISCGSKYCLDTFHVSCFSEGGVEIFPFSPHISQGSIYFHPERWTLFGDTLASITCRKCVLYCSLWYICFAQWVCEIRVEVKTILIN